MRHTKGETANLYSGHGVLALGVDEAHLPVHETRKSSPLRHLHRGVKDVVGVIKQIMCRFKTDRRVSVLFQVDILLLEPRADWKRLPFWRLLQRESFSRT